MADGACFPAAIGLGHAPVSKANSSNIFWRARAAQAAEAAEQTAQPLVKHVLTKVAAASASIASQHAVPPTKGCNGGG
jgi:hypothetical protein